jgi:hypothetical protein
MQTNRKKISKQESIRRAFGLLAYTSHELRYLKGGELETIMLTSFEFELLVDNLHGQQQLVNRKGGGKVEDLVAIFRNEDHTTITVHFNSKKVKVYDFKNSVDHLMFITDLDYKKVYAEFSRV